MTDKLERPDLEQRARELLARECEQEGFAQHAANVREGLDLEGLNPANVRVPISCAIRAITKALASSSVPEQETPQSIPSEREEIVKWRCFHCGDVFTDERCARLHFGRDEGSAPACIIKGADGGLLRALRDAEEQADEAIQAMHAESTDAARAYHRQRRRHTQALMAAEEAGYERGLADGREHLTRQALEQGSGHG